jgi:hypothetical protein
MHEQTGKRDFSIMFSCYANHVGNTFKWRKNLKILIACFQCVNQYMSGQFWSSLQITCIQLEWFIFSYMDSIEIDHSFKSFNQVNLYHVRIGYLKSHIMGCAGILNAVLMI